jgi:REP element-mobilizing transposase RayT
MRRKGRKNAGEQRELVFRTRGGKRDGARRHPLHVTLRAAPGLPSLRRQVLFAEVRSALAVASRTWFRLLHFSVQSNHIHLMLETLDRARSTKGMRGLAIRVALSVNRVLRRRGKVWGDRYHCRALRTPREVRHGLVYVIANWKKHTPNAWGFDPCSSAWWFDGWKMPPSSGPPGWNVPEPPVWAPREWLSATGWRRHGSISRYARPAS